MYNMYMYMYMYMYIFYCIFEMTIPIVLVADLHRQVNLLCFDIITTQWRSFISWFISSDPLLAYCMATKQDDFSPYFINIDVISWDNRLVFAVN
jgi:hypothetical protein